MLYSRYLSSNCNLFVDVVFYVCDFLLSPIENSACLNYSYLQIIYFQLALGCC